MFWYRDYEDDESWLEAIRYGEPHAWHQLQQVVYRDVIRFQQSDSDTDDILQEVFIQVHRSLDRVDLDRTRLTSWLVAVTRNVIRDRRRRLERVPKQVELDRVAAGLIDTTPSAEERLEDFEIDSLLADAVRQLEPRVREAVVLRFFYAMPLREVAKELDCSPRTAGRLIDKGLHCLSDVVARLPELTAYCWY